MEKKMTYAVALDKAIEVVVDEEVKSRLVELKASLQKKSAKSGQKKVSDADKALYDAVSAIMADGKARTCSEIIAMGTLPVAEGSVISTQKMVSVFKAIGCVGVKGEKGKTFYSFPADAEATTDADADAE